jgi:uncharacterized protein (TIGR03437 family)
MSPKILILTAGFLLGGDAGAQQYLISTLSGGAPLPASAKAVSSAIGAPGGLAIDREGTVLFTSMNCVFRLDAAGTLTRIAGNARAGFSGDGGTATSAQLNDPRGIAMDATGNLFIADSLNGRIRRVSPRGIITTVAGGGTSFPTTGTPAVKANLGSVGGVATDSAGNLFISASALVRVSKDGLITRLAEDCCARTGLATDAAGNLFVADGFNRRVRKVAPNGMISTVAGTGALGNSGDGGPATSAQLVTPNSVAVDAAGNLFITDVNSVRKVSPGGIITTVTQAFSSYRGDRGLAIRSGAFSPVGAAADSAGNLFLADRDINRDSNRILVVSPDGAINTAAGNGALSYSGDGGPATEAQWDSPAGVAVDAAGNLLIADLGNNRVRKISPDRTVTALAGNGQAGDSGDGGQATDAQLLRPASVAVDLLGNVFIADAQNNRVRKVSPGGIVTTLAGNGTSGYSGDGGAATSARLNEPSGVAVDASGNVFISDTANLRIRKVTPAGVITTVAGRGPGGFSSTGDGGAATDAYLYGPRGIYLDTAGNLFIADKSRVRKISPGGLITTVAGTQPFGVAGDGGPATSVELGTVPSVAGDASGNLYILDAGRQRVYRVAPGGTITTIAGGSGIGYSGDGGPATTALVQLSSLSGLALDSQGTIYIADSGNNAVRRLTPTSREALVSAVMDAAGLAASPVTPGKIVVVLGSNLGPESLVENRPVDGSFGPQVGGTSISFDGVPAPMLWASTAAAAAIAPYEIAGSSTVKVAVTTARGVSETFVAAVAASAPSFFSANITGSGQIAAVNCDGALNDAAHPVRRGACISLYATGEGQTSPVGVNGKLAPLSPPYPQPLLPVSVTVGGIPVVPLYAGASPTLVAGLMQIVITIPPGVEAGGSVPVVLTVGSNSTVEGAAWIAVAN